MDQNNPKVSVIIPIYNAEDYLRQCLDCLRKQTLQDIEILCVDDGSTDLSADILREYQEADPRFIVLTQKNGGAGKARNTGMKEARGEYLYFCDADDFFEAEMLEKACERADEFNADIVVWHSKNYMNDTGKYQPNSWAIMDQALPPYRPKYYRNFTENVFKVFVGWAWDKLFRTAMIREYDLKFQEIRTTNDMLFVYSAIVLARRIEVLSETLYYHRRNDENSLSNTREKSWECFHEALAALKINLKSYGKYDELHQDYINYCLNSSLWNLNTLKGSAQQQLYEKLKSEWFEELEITSLPAGDFYNEDEYRQYTQIQSSSFEDWLKSK